jgi:hypothetical protein
MDLGGDLQVFESWLDEHRLPRRPKCEHWRRALPAAAALTIVILPPSDWPLGWSVWVEHPLVSGRGATTGTLVDAILRRRRHVAGSTWFANRDPCRSSNRSEIVRTFRH